MTKLKIRTKNLKKDLSKVVKLKLLRKLILRKKKIKRVTKNFCKRVKCFNKIYLLKRFTSNFYKNKVHFRLARHNIFATYSLFKTNKTITSRSTGAYKIKCSRRTMKFVLPKFLFKFSNFLKKEINVNSTNSSLHSVNNIVFDIIARKRFRRRIFKKFSSFKKQHSLLWIIRSKKCFNGCRVSKRRRKKSIKFRIIR